MTICKGTLEHEWLNYPFLPAEVQNGQIVYDDISLKKKHTLKIRQLK